MPCRDDAVGDSADPAPGADGCNGVLVNEDFHGTGIDDYRKAVESLETALEALAGDQIEDQGLGLLQVLKKESVLDIDVMSAHRATAPSLSGSEELTNQRTHE